VLDYLFLQPDGLRDVYGKESDSPSSASEAPDILRRDFHTGRTPVIQLSSKWNEIYVSKDIAKEIFLASLAILG
jgi:hypothetical protein